MKKPLNTELTLTTQDGDKAKITDLSPAVMQALYYQFTGNTEEIRQSFDDNYIVKH